MRMRRSKLESPQEKRIRLTGVRVKRPISNHYLKLEPISDIPNTARRCTKRTVGVIGIVGSVIFSQFRRCCLVL